MLILIKLDVFTVRFGLVYAKKSNRIGFFSLWKNWPKPNKKLVQTEFVQLGLGWFFLLKSGDPIPLEPSNFPTFSIYA
jgi:hypothetical protein